jgi:hypothetical protein
MMMSEGFAGHGPVLFLGKLAGFFLAQALGDVLADGDQRHRIAIGVQFDLAMGVEDLRGVVRQQRPQRDVVQAIEEGLSRAHCLADHLGDMNLLRHAEMFSQPGNVRLDRRVDAHQRVHARRPGMRAVDKIVAPIADLHRAFGQHKSIALALVRWTRVIWAFELGDASRLRPLPVFVARSVRQAG